MAQGYPDIPASDKIVDSRPKFLERDDTLRSEWSGVVFPSAPVAGQRCFRTDLNASYQWNGTTWIPTPRAGDALLARDTEIQLAALDAAALFVDGARAVTLAPSVAADGPLRVWTWTAASTATASASVLRPSTGAAATGAGRWLLAQQTVEDAIVDGVTGRAPSQNAVFDALALQPTRVTNITALRALSITGAVPTSIRLAHNWLANDGGGEFDLLAGDTTTADDGGIVIVTASAQRYRRRFSGPVLSTWFFRHDDVEDGARIQLWLNACKNRKGFLCKGIGRTAQTLIFAADANYFIEGEGHDPNGINVSCIRNVGTGGTFYCDSSANPDDNHADLKAFAIQGGGASAGHGIHLLNVTRVRFHDLNISNCGQSGVRLRDCWTAVLERVASNNNGHYGLHLLEQGNQVKIDACIFNGNGRVDGYGNIAIIGTTTEQNLGVMMVASDFTGAGQNPFSGTITTSFGLILQHSFNVELVNNYCEWAVSELIYVGTGNRCIRFLNNYVQDGRVNFDGVEECQIEFNLVRNQINRTTRLDVTGVGDVVARGNVKLESGGAVGFAFNDTAFQRRERFGTAAPTSGTWAVGDIVYNRAPAAGGSLGWICTTAGTPGTWKTFAAIAA